MIDPSPNPSRQLRIFACIARWLLGLVLAFWLLLAAAWGTLHGFIVPRIGEWRAEVERLATQTLGAPVRIDALSAQSRGLFPTIHLDGVHVLDAQGRDALKLQRVVATVSARSLLRLGLEQLYIDAPQLDIRHLRDGRWQVAGLDVVQSDATESAGLDWLLEQPELVIRKGQVHFTDEQRAVPTIQLLDVDVVLRNRRWSHVLRVERAGDGERDDPCLLGRGGGEGGELLHRPRGDDLPGSVGVRCGEAVGGERLRHLLRLAADDRAHAGRPHSAR